MSKTHSIRAEDSVLLVIDIQDRLLPAIDGHERLVTQCVRLIEGARALGVPLVWTEQYVRGLGATNDAIRTAIGDAAAPLEKMTFGCLQDEGIAKAVRDTGRGTLVLCGMETHVCVLQTAMRALDLGMRVVLVQDAVSSRFPENRAVGLDRMMREGVLPTTVESLLLEWTEVSGTDTFKKILPLIK